MPAAAGPRPTTAGIWYSRATIAPWLSTPPVAVTTALTVPKSGVHDGEVISATRMSPGRTRVVSCGDCMTLAGPRTRPGEPPMPCSTPGTAVAVAALAGPGAAPSV